MMDCCCCSDALKKLILMMIVLLMVHGVKSTAPIKFLDDIYYAESNTCYHAEYDIVDVHLPHLLYRKHKMFLVQADLQTKTYKGAFVLQFYGNQFRNMTARKLLDNGKCITSDDKNVYIGATDGIYTYNYINDTVERYGSVTIDIKDIEKDKSKDLFYVVSETNKLYLVSNRGNDIVEHDVIKNVEEIATDKGNNLYFYEKHDDPEKFLMFFEKYSKPKVLVGNEILNISGLPDVYINMKLISYPRDNGADIIMNNLGYILYPNGTSESQNKALLDVPTACSIDMGHIRIYGHQKKLSCYVVRIAPLIAELFKLLNAIKNAFQKISS